MSRSLLGVALASLGLMLGCENSKGPVNGTATQPPSPTAATGGAPSKIPADALTALVHAETFELYSLDPSRSEERPKDAFHGWKALGTTTIADASAAIQPDRAFMVMRQSLPSREYPLEPCHTESSRSLLS